MMILLELTDEEYKLVLKSLDYFSNTEIDEEYPEEQSIAAELLHTLESIF